MHKPWDNGNSVTRESKELTDAPEERERERERERESERERGGSGLVARGGE